MIKIDKKLMEYLEKEGCKFGEDLHRTYGKGKNKTYYATESSKVKNLIEKFNNSRIIK